MGLLVDGIWHQQEPANKDGKFKRAQTSFRNFITPDGAAGPSGEAGFQAEAGRYHLYVCLACPWAHRTLIMRKLKGLESMISMSTVHWLLLDDGWQFGDGEQADSDPLFGFEHLHQVYTQADDKYTGRVSVPVLWDKHNNTIVSNESAEIMRMFNSAFDAIGATPGDYYPEALQAEIDAVNARIYNDINNGVYKVGFATQQAAYEENFTTLFSALDWVEERLSAQMYLVGEQITEADWRLFTTLVRFDAVYVGHFKCNLRRIADYPNLSAYMQRLYDQPGIVETINMQHIKNHYYQSHKRINPTQIVPLGPDVLF